jgi:hypothetical protein
MISSVKTSRFGVSSRILVTAAMASVESLVLDRLPFSSRRRTQSSWEMDEGLLLSMPAPRQDDPSRRRVTEANRPRNSGRLAISASSDALVPQNSMLQEERADGRDPPAKDRTDSSGTGPLYSSARRSDASTARRKPWQRSIQDLIKRTAGRKPKSFAMAADRLSALPDRVLQRVVSLLRVGDAARTSLLSQRWRTIWLQADGVNLDSRCYRDVGYNGERVGRELFRDALAAVGAAGRQPVRRLSVAADSYFQNDFLRDIPSASPGMDAVLASPATRHLEKLCMNMHAEFCQSYDEYVLPASRLPCRSSLRVLDLYACTLGPPGAAAAFPCLKTLKVVSCISSSLEGLQAMLDAAPSLRLLWLKRISFMDEKLDREARLKRRLLLRCPDATATVAVIRCHGTDGLDVDAPGARSLLYKGFLEHFPLGGPAAPSGPPENLHNAQLKFCTARCCCNDPLEEAPPHVVFWESIGRFSRLRVLKLKILDINDVAVLNAEEDVFLKAFPELVFL